MKYRFVRDHCGRFPVQRMCRAPGLSLSAYYAWRARPESRRVSEDRRLLVQIKAIHWAKRGTYGSPRIHAELKAHGMLCSMSRKGDCWDNAPMESFFHTLKTELSHHRAYHTRWEAKADIFEYIEVFYNRGRRHSALCFIAPADYERLNLVA